MKTIIILISSFFLTAYGKDSNLGNFTKEEIKEILSSVGINIDDVKISWNGRCSMDSFPGFSVVALRNVKFNGNLVPKGAEINNCDKYFESIIVSLKPPKNVINFDGVPCHQRVTIQASNGKICECDLAEDYEVRGYKIDKSTRVYFEDGKFRVFSGDGEKTDRSGKKGRVFEINERGQLELFTGDIDRLSVVCQPSPKPAPETDLDY